MVVHGDGDELRAVLHAEVVFFFFQSLQKYILIRQ